MKLIKILATLSAAALVLPAHAGLTVYTDQAAFQAAAGTTTVETFSAAPLGASTNAFSGTFNGFSLTSQSNGNYSGIVNTTYNGDGGMPSSFAGQNFYGLGSSAGDAGPTSSFTFASGTRAFGFDFFNTDSTDRYSITVNGITQVAIDYFSSGFFGIVATGGDTFSSASIQSDDFGGYVSTVGLDNILVDVTSVPEPTGLALLGIALFGFAAARRTSRN